MAIVPRRRGAKVGAHSCAPLRITCWLLGVLARASICCLLLVGCHATTPKGIKVNVVRVVSGQSLMVSDESGLSSVRLVGIDAPDLQQQPWGRAAKKRLEDTIDRQPVLLEFDREAERQGRRLAYVWKDGVLLNEQLVKEGYALAVPRSPNHKYDRRLERAREWARLMGQGIWNPENPMRLTPAEFRHQNRQS